MNLRSSRTLSLALLAVAAHAHGQTFTWTGSGDGKSWSSSANWLNDARPRNLRYTTGLVFNDDADGILANDYPSTFRLNSLSLLKRGYSLSGGKLGFAGGGLLRMGDGNAGGGDTSIANDISINDNGDATNGDLNVKIEGGTTTLSGVVSGSGRLVKDGPYRLVLSGLNTYTGGTLLRSGTVLLGSDSALGTGDLTLAGGRLQMDGHTATVRNLVLGNGALGFVEAVTNTGRLRLQGNVAFNGAPNRGTAAYTLSPDIELLTGTHVFGDNGNRASGTGADVTFSGAVSGTGGIEKTGGSFLSLTGLGSYTGGTRIRAGGLGVANLNGDYANDGTLALTNADGQTYGGSISGAGSFEKYGEGDLRLTRPLAQTGGTRILGGSLTLTADNQLPVGGDLALASGSSLFLNRGGRQTIGNVSVRGGTLAAVNGDDEELTVGSGELFPSVLRVQRLIKVGPGDLFAYAVPGNGSYIEETVIRGGRLLSFDDSETQRIFPSSSLTLAGGGLVLYAAGGSTVYGSIRLGDGQTQGYLGSIDPFVSQFRNDKVSLTLEEQANVSEFPNVAYQGAPGRTSDPVTLDIGLNLSRNTFIVELKDNGNRSGGDVDVTINGPIRGRQSYHSILKTGESVFRLKGDTDYEGGTMVRGGTLIVERPAGNYQTDAKLRFEIADVSSIGAVTGTGDLTKTGGGTLTVGGVLGSTGRIDVQGGSVIGAGRGVYEGSFALGRDADFVNVSGGTIEFAKNAVVDGFFTTARRSSTVFAGLVTGSGSFDGRGTLEFRGGYSPGNSPASVEIEGPVSFASDLTMELGGTALGTGYDHLTLDSLATLGGGLKVAYYGGFAASAGQSFDLFDWDGGLSGRFTSIALPTLANGLAWDASALYTSGIVSVQAVPEPAAVAVLGIGLLGLLRRRRK